MACTAPEGVVQPTLGRRTSSQKSNKRQASLSLRFRTLDETLLSLRSPVRFAQAADAALRQQFSLLLPQWLRAQHEQKNPLGDTRGFLVSPIRLVLVDCPTLFCLVLHGVWGKRTRPRLGSKGPTDSWRLPISSGGGVTGRPPYTPDVGAVSSRL